MQRFLIRGNISGCIHDLQLSGLTLNHTDAFTTALRNSSCRKLSLITERVSVKVRLMKNEISLKIYITLLDPVIRLILN